MTCGGDSGSPLVFFNSEERHYVQVGIVSGGTCQSKSDPAIFARIEDHQTLEFIREQFWKHILPTGVQAIEKIMSENKALARRCADLEEKNDRLESKVDLLEKEQEQLITKVEEMFKKIEDLENKEVNLSNQLVSRKV